MLKFLFFRLLWMVLTLWVVFTVSFFLMRSVKGGPLDRDRVLPPEIRENIERRYHLNDPLLTQYWDQLKLLARGDLGYSFRMGDYTVNQVIAEGLPVSATLGLLALIFAIALGLAAGITSAAFRGTFWDVALMSLATIGIAVPSFVVAGIAIVVFVFVIPIFPAAGWGSLDQLILPAICLGLPHAADIARISRTSLLDVLSQDYIRTARAKGLSRARVIWQHALPGALLPIVSYLGPTIADILTGSLVIESIFAIPGLGSHFVEAALQRDYTLAMGCVMLYLVLLFALNTLVDISYSLLDPRVDINK